MRWSFGIKDLLESGQLFLLIVLGQLLGRLLAKLRLEGVSLKHISDELLFVESIVLGDESKSLFCRSLAQILHG